MKHLLLLSLICLLAIFSTGCEAVTGGHYALPPGATLSGELVVIGGNAVLEQGSRVTGAAFVTGGTVRADGQIDGDVLVTGGTIDFGPSALVRGTVQRAGGSVSIARGASVRTVESVGFRVPGSRVASLLSLFIIFPLVLVLILIILFAVGTSRRGAPQTAVWPSVSAASGASSRGLSYPPSGSGAELRSSIILGSVLIGLGVLFLLQEFLKLDIWHYAWPLLILVPGLFCFAAMLVGGKNAGGLAVLGSLLTVLGLIFLVQNTFDLYQTWAYAWALIPLAIGIGQVIDGWWTGRPDLRARGGRLIWSSLIIFVLLGGFFELVLNLSGFFRGDVGRIAFPVLLIVIGALLLFSRFFNLASQKPTGDASAGTRGAGPTPPTGNDA
jgi:LiaF transmembrane domain